MGLHGWLNGNFGEYPVAILRRVQCENRCGLSKVAYS